MYGPVIDQGEIAQNMKEGNNENLAKHLGVEEEEEETSSKGESSPQVQFLLFFFSNFFTE